MYTCQCVQAHVPCPWPRTRVRACRNLVDKLTPLKKAKSDKAQTERLELLTQRGEVQDAFIAKKKAARAQIALLRAKNEGLGALKERELRELQEAYRDINNEFKELGIMVDRDELLEGAAARRTGAEDPGSMTNKELLGEAHRIQQDNTAKLQVRAARRRRRAGSHCGHGVQCACARARARTCTHVVNACV
ncbi:hypothetical protein EON67_08395 [archaeon]|nr:MAG: hypothetical protein EON67_08395 [archaeon]